MPTPGLRGAIDGPSLKLFVRQYVDVFPSYVLVTSLGCWASPSATNSLLSWIFICVVFGFAVFLSPSSVGWLLLVSSDVLRSINASANCQLPRPRAAMRSADTPHFRALPVRLWSGGGGG